MNNSEKIINESLDSVIGNCFGRYAKYVIQDRALPDIRDGLKPVQRRILYAMYELGLTYEKAYKKSARTVGEVIGKYHPHGDSSIYEAMVRMSQNWKNNLPLLDMHGNNGSIDGDPAAAMRYTECKLSKVANLMLENIKNETVDFAFNFDDSEKEPKILPSFLPNLLINGAVGIAAGYATNIPPFNPSEVFDATIALINNPKMTNDEMLSIIKGPDFPTGAIIEGQQGILDFYNTGKGKFLITSKFEFNTSNSKYNQIIISEIPYDTNKSQIIKEINEILYEEKISGLIEVRDESDKNGINIVIDVKKDKNLEVIKNYLIKNTHLQINYAVNFVAIVNQKPILLTITQALQNYIDHALLIQKKVAIFNLKKAEKRYEIVNGLIIATNNIDKVIALIRHSDSKESAKQNLINEFAFTDNQAEAIVTLRLYRLSRTNVIELMQEAELLRKTIDELNKLIASEKLQKETFKKMLLSFKNEYGFARKTFIETNTVKVEINELDVIDVQDSYIFVSRDGYIKLVSPKSYDSNLYSDIGRANNDFVFFSKKCKTNESLYLVSKYGKTFVLPLYKLKQSKWKDIGVHINTYINLTSDDKIIFANTFISLNDEYQIVLATKNGLVKRMVSSEAFNSKQLKQTNCIKLKDNDYLTTVEVIETKANYFVSLLSSSGKAYCFSSVEIPLLMKNASGVKSIKLKPNEYLVKCICSKTLTLDLCVVLNNDIKLFKMDELSVLSRVSSGKQLLHLKNQEIISWFMVNKLSSLNLSLSDNTITFAKLPNIKLDNNTIIDAYYSHSNSFGLIENISEAKVLPKSIIIDNEEQLQLEQNED